MKLNIIDPIFRGSRLFYSYLATEKFINEDNSVYLYTRDTYETDHFNEFFLKNGINKIPILPYFNIDSKKWFFKVSWRDAFRVFRSFFYKKSDDIIYLPGLNEWFPKLFLLLIFFGSKNRVIGIEYDPSFLLDRRSFRSKMKNIIFDLVLLRCPKMKVGVLDERVEVGGALFFLPDPGNIGAVSLTSQSVFRQKSKDKVVILLVGLQSKRKGLEFVYNAFKSSTNELPDNVIFKLVGRFSDDTINLRELILCEERWEVLEGYFSEGEIIEHYRSSDFVLIPYDRSFNSSSGVLAYATMLGIPVLVSDHGLIGHKVFQHELGYRFQYGNSSEFLHIIAKAATFKDYQSFKTNCIVYSENNSSSRHQEILHEKYKEYFNN